MWLLISVPLVLLGTWIGFKRIPYEQPTKATQIPRQIPRQPWYLGLVPTILIGGAIPFAVIFIELLFVFKSIWQDKSGYYYMYGFLALIVVILLITIVEITIVVTYFQLCAEVSLKISCWHKTRIPITNMAYRITIGGGTHSELGQHPLYTSSYILYGTTSRNYTFKDS